MRYSEYFTIGKLAENSGNFPYFISYFTNTILCYNIKVSGIASPIYIKGGYKKGLFSALESRFASWAGSASSPTSAGDKPFLFGTRRKNGYKVY